MPKGIPLTEEEVAKRRHEIFHQVLKILLKKGFQETSMREIAEAAGLGKSTLYDYFKTKDKETGRPYTSRYVGSLVADFHRNLLKGGIFMYPADLKDPKKPTGKLRLMVEANPLAMVVNQAGGYASDGHGPVLEIQPQELHQRIWNTVVRLN